MRLQPSTKLRGVGSVYSKGLVFAEKPSIGIEPTRLYDASRFRNHGVHTNITMVQLPNGLWVRGFNGSSSKIVITLSDELKLDKGGFSIGLWVNFDSFSATSSIISAQRGTTRGWNLDATTSPRWSFGHVGLTDLTTLGTVAALSTGQWYHVFCVYDTAKAYIYENGAEDVSENEIGKITTPIDNVHLGRYAASATQFLSGYIALVGIYNYALSAGKIKQIFKAARHWFEV